MKKLHKLFCKKLGREVSRKELEEHQCLQKAIYRGKPIICRNLINAETNKPIFLELFPKREPKSEDILEKTARTIARIKEAYKEIEEKGDVFHA